MSIGNAMVGGVLRSPLHRVMSRSLMLLTFEGRRTGKEYMAGMKKAEELQAAGQAGPSSELLAINRTQRGVVLHAVGSLVTLLILIDMIWKPGA